MDPLIFLTHSSTLLFLNKRDVLSKSKPKPSPLLKITFKKERPPLRGLVRQWRGSNLGAGDGGERSCWGSCSSSVLSALWGNWSGDGSQAPPDSDDSPGFLSSGSVMSLFPLHWSPGKPQSMGHWVAALVSLPISLDNHLTHQGKQYIMRSNL